MNSVYEVTMKLRALQQSVINNLAPNWRREREREREREIGNFYIRWQRNMMYIFCIKFHGTCWTHSGSWSNSQHQCSWSSFSHL